MWYLYRCVQYPQARRGCWIPWNLSYRELWTTRCGYWEPNPGLQEEQKVLFTAEPSVLGFLFLHKTSWPRSKLGRKGFIHLILPHCVHHQRKSGLELKQVRKQELMQRPRRNVPSWLASPGLPSLLSYRTKTTSPKMVPPTRGPSRLDH
jgi:hypothetical protein